MIVLLLHNCPYSCPFAPNLERVKPKTKKIAKVRPAPRTIIKCVFCVWVGTRGHHHVIIKIRELEHEQAEKTFIISKFCPLRACRRVAVTLYNCPLTVLKNRYIQDNTLFTQAHPALARRFCFLSQWLSRNIERVSYSHITSRTTRHHRCGRFFCLIRFPSHLTPLRLSFRVFLPRRVCAVVSSHPRNNKSCVDEKRRFLRDRFS